MQLSIESLVAPIVSIVVSVIVAWIAMSTRLAVLETKIDDLAEDVRKHNDLIERVTKLEVNDKAQWERLDERRAQANATEHELHQLHNLVSSFHHVGGTE